LQRWFAEQQIQPRIVGEFDDSALMQAFGQSGSGIFIGPSVIADEVKRQCDVELIGQTDAVRESFYAISVERKVKHPGIVAITEGARRQLDPRPGEGGGAASQSLACHSMRAIPCPASRSASWPAIRSTPPRCAG